MTGPIGITEQDKQDAITEMHLQGELDKILDQIQQENPALYAEMLAACKAEDEANGYVADEQVLQ